MPKKVLQDIIKPVDRSNRDNNDRKWEYEETSIDNTPTESDDAFPEGISKVLHDSEKKRSPLRDIYIVVVIILVMLGGYVLYAGASPKATVQVSLTKQAVTLSDIFTASEVGSDKSITYKKIVLTKKGTKKVTSTSEENVEKKASGLIVVYNKYSTKPQTYVKRTRFQAPDGKIYRTNKSIIVPGKKKDGTPGSVEVRVYADQNGEAYNIGLVDFTIPGLKGSPSFEKVYARSKTPMTGGYVGVLRSASPEDLQKANKELSLELKKSLLAELKKGVPQETQLVIDDGVFVDYTSSSENDPSSDNQVVIKGESTLRAFVLDKDSLSNIIARSELSSYDGKNIIDVNNFEDLNFRFIDKDTFDPVEDTEFKVEVTGEAQLVWTLNDLKLKEALAGTSAEKKAFFALLQTYPSIRDAEAKIDPFWRKTFPNDPADIEIVEKE